MAPSESVRAATSIPLRPIDVPAQAAACQVCAETPGTKVAADNPASGTFQLTSPVSDEAAPKGVDLSVVTVSGPGRLRVSSSDFRNSSVNCCSSGVYWYPPAF